MEKVFDESIKQQKKRRRDLSTAITKGKEKTGININDGTEKLVQQLKRNKKFQLIL